MDVRLVMTTGVVGILGFLSFFTPLWTLLNWTAIIAFSIAGFGLGAASVLCSGKNFSPKNNDTRTVTNILMRKMMVRICNIPVIDVYFIEQSATIILANRLITALTVTFSLAHLNGDYYEYNF